MGLQQQGRLFLTFQLSNFPQYGNGQAPATSIVPLVKTETLRVRNVVDATRLGAWLRPGEGIGWLAVGTMPNSLYRIPVVYLFLACVFCYSCSFLFVVFKRKARAHLDLLSFVFCVFLLLSLELGRCSSDIFLSSRPRTGLAITYCELAAYFLNHPSCGKL